jgi:hypothetical protein
MFCIVYKCCVILVMEKREEGEEKYITGMDGEIEGKKKTCPLDGPSSYLFSEFKGLLCQTRLSCKR